MSKPEYEGPKKTEIANRFCEFVDGISNSSNGVLWGFARQVNDGEVLISFLKELATKGYVSQIDKIFRSGSYRCPLVNQLSKYYETKKNLMSCSKCSRRTTRMNYLVKLSVTERETKITHTH